MGHGSRLAGVLGGAVLAGVVGSGCQSQVAGSGSFAGPAAPSRTPTANGTGAGSGTPTPLPPTLPTIPTTFAGRWSGPVDQPRSTIPHWTAVLTMPAGQLQGTFEIAGHCTGVLTLLAFSGNRLVAAERITSDPQDVCADGGGVTMELSGTARARFTWVDYSNSSNVATGTVSRR